MELRVWVDGAQRVVCGVKVTTTCQEIVFALAHATQQAGRFTMIERWRNNERLLSPGEQPLVTLQRWGDHMNEVEFILRKTSSEPSQPLPAASQATATNHLTQQQQQPQPPLPLSQQQQQQHIQPIQQHHIQPQLHQQPPEQQKPTGVAEHPSNSFRPTLSAPTLPNVTNNVAPFEDLYSTINKKRNHQPPAVPAKPRVMNPIGNLPMPQTMNNAQMNFYHPNQSPHSVYSNNLRPRHPPAYLDYLEAMASSRNSLPQPLMPNHSYVHQSHNAQASNIYPRSYDPQQMYAQHQNGSSPANSSTASNKYCYQADRTTNHLNSMHGPDTSTPSSGIQNFNNAVNSKLADSGLVINRGSAVNVKLLSNLSQSHSFTHSSKMDPGERLNTSAQSNASSVSQMGHDMLKLIEEQKQVLLNQKNELDRLDNDQEYWEAKQSSEEAELINRIEDEIRQLDELWRENHKQIEKLENHNFEKELEQLKSEQIKMELEIDRQKAKLADCDKDIARCKSKIELLEAELANQELNDTYSEDEAVEPSTNHTEKNISKSSPESVKIADLKQNNSNGSSRIGDQDIRSSEDEGNEEDEDDDDDDDDDSGGDASDDLDPRNTDSTKLRSAKTDVAYVDKRGLINGIRSLKLYKSRGRYGDTNNHSSSEVNSSSVSANGKEKASINNNMFETECPETNGHNHNEKTANKYEFLMTL